MVFTQPKIEPVERRPLKSLNKPGSFTVGRFEFLALELDLCSKNLSPVALTDLAGMRE